MANNGYTQFNDTSKEVIKELRKLSGRALRAGGKVAAKAVQKNTPVKSGKLKEAIGYRVKNSSDGTPYLEIGFFNKKTAKKKGRAYFANPSWIEFGTKPHVIRAGVRRGSVTTAKVLRKGRFIFGAQVNVSRSARPFVKTTIMASIAEIRQAQEKGLAALSQKIEELKGIPDDYEIEDGESP